MVRVRVKGKIKDSNVSESSSSNTNSEYETDTETTEKKKPHKRKTTRCRSQDSEHKRARRFERRCRSHEGRLPEEEVRRVKRRGSEDQVPCKKTKTSRSRSRTRSSSHESCGQMRCNKCKKPTTTTTTSTELTDAELFPGVAVFNLQLIGNLPDVIQFIFAKKKWLVVHLTDLPNVDKAVPIHFWMDDDVIKELQHACYVIQISLDTNDGKSVVYKYRCLSKECILIIDPVSLEKRAFWQSFNHIDDVYPELLCFLDSQKFYQEDGHKNYFPGKKGTNWPHCLDSHLLPGPSNKFDKMPRSPSLSPESDSIRQSEPLNLSRRVSTTTFTLSTEDNDNDIEDDYYLSESPSSQTANVSETGSQDVSSVGNPPTPSSEPYDPEDFSQDQDQDQDHDDEDQDQDEDAAAPPPGGDDNLMDEINMQHAIMKSLGLPSDPNPNPLEPIVEITEKPLHQSPMLRGSEAQPQPQPQPQTMALMPVTDSEGRTAMKLVPCLIQNPFVNPLPAHSGGDAVNPFAAAKQYLTICFVMPWGARHYVRELHANHTMKDLLLFLQTYLKKYKDIEWFRDIITLKMVNPNRNLSKLPLLRKLRDCKLGASPVIFVFHTQFLDRLF